MRIRSTKPEFWRSERISSVDWDARLVLKGLESFVDDNGVGKDDLALIVSDVFPRDLAGNPTGTLRRVSEALDHLSEAGLLWRYEVKGTKLLYVAFWESVQRIEKPGKGRLPRPDGTMDYRESEIREYSGNTPVVLPEPSGREQGNRGTGEQGNSSSAPPAAEVPDRPDMNPDAILQSHGMPEAERRTFKTWLIEERKVRSLAPWLTKVHTAGEVPDLIQAWRATTKPKKVHPSRDPSNPHYGQEWMFRQ